MRIIIPASHACNVPDHIRAYNHTFTILDNRRFSTTGTQSRLREMPCPACNATPYEDLHFEDATWEGAMPIREGAYRGR